MRPIGRIDVMLAALAAYWRSHPDLRLGQIVGNFTPTGCDPYYVEDDVILDALRGIDVQRG